MTRVTVIVPTFDEELELAAVLDHLAGLPGRLEVIVADGGSRDGTVGAAHARGVRVVAEGRGRAGQLNAAVDAAAGDVLVFLHADSRLPGDAHAALAAVPAAVAGGNFTLRFDGSDRFARLLTRCYAFQRRHGYYYGDSTIWVRREVFARLGGYRELPIMDDYDLVRRLERAHRTARIAQVATTSPRRWRAQGIPRTLLSWWVIRWLYVAGVPPRRLAALYRRVR